MFVAPPPPAIPPPPVAAVAVLAAATAGTAEETRGAKSEKCDTTAVRVLFTVSTVVERTS